MTWDTVENLKQLALIYCEKVGLNAHDNFNMGDKGVKQRWELVSSDLKNIFIMMELYQNYQKVTDIEVIIKLSEVKIGTIIPWNKENEIPSGYVICYGQACSEELFPILHREGIGKIIQEINHGFIPNLHTITPGIVYIMKVCEGV